MIWDKVLGIYLLSWSSTCQTAHISCLLAHLFCNCPFIRFLLRIGELVLVRFPNSQKVASGLGRTSVKYTSSAGAVKSIDSKHVTSRRVFLHKNPSHGNGASTDKSFPKCLWKFPTEKAMRITRSEMGDNGRGENYFWKLISGENQLKLLLDLNWKQIWPPGRRGPTQRHSLY